MSGGCSVVDVDATAPLFLLGMPRSGTTWVSQIFEAHPQFTVRLSPNFSYRFKDRLSVRSSAEDWRTLLRQVADSDDEFTSQEWQRRRGNLPPAPDRTDVGRLVIKDTRFHDLYRHAMDEVLPGAQCVYLVRHPLAALDSWRRSPEFPDDADFRHEWRHGTCRKRDTPGEHWGFDDWVALTADYRRRAATEPARYFVVRYEDLIDDPQTTLHQLFAFTGTEAAPAALDFVAQSHARHSEDPYSVWKDPNLTRDVWRGSMPGSVTTEVLEELARRGLEEFAS